MTSQKSNIFHVSADDFRKIPGSPIAYWASDGMISAFGKQKAIDFCSPRQGFATGDNNRFLRGWHEVDFSRINFNAKNGVINSGKWFPCNKGGSFRRWYGNNLRVVNWELDGVEMKAFSGSVIRNPKYYFREGITWSTISSFKLSMRFSPSGFLFESKGSVCFFKDQQYLKFFLGYFNSVIPENALLILTPTLDFHEGPIGQTPIVIHSKDNVDQIVSTLIDISHRDWDSYEASWDFQENPLIDANRHNDKSKDLSDLYGQVRASWEQHCETMRKLEVENNRIFIEIYGLQDELSPDVPWDEITLTCNPWYRYGKSPELESDGQHFSTTGEPKVGTIFGMQPTGIKVSEPNQEMKVTSFPFNQELEDRLQKDTVKELISYAVGCMFGRYSLDVPGLAFAGGEWESTNYMTFQPDADNVIPILDEDWFADDIVGRFQEFLKVAFGEENFHENLTFIEAALGKDIRSYFTKDFYTDHVKTYRNRTIYWLFSSPTGAFSALIYLHRYRQDTVGTVLTYLRSHITKVNSHIQEQEEIIASAKASASMKSKAVRERLKMQHELQELEDYERDVLYPLSTERLKIDLDDGVKVNYPKFGKALRPVKGLDAKEE